MGPPYAKSRKQVARSVRRLAGVLRGRLSGGGAEAATVIRAGKHGARSHHWQESQRCNRALRQDAETASGQVANHLQTNY